MPNHEQAVEDIGSSVISWKDRDEMNRRIGDLESALKTEQARAAKLQEQNNELRRRLALGE